MGSNENLLKNISQMLGGANGAYSELIKYQENMTPSEKAKLAEAQDKIKEAQNKLNDLTRNATQNI